MKNIFSKTTAEKRTQNGVKTDLKRTHYGFRILIFAFLTLGFGQAWAGVSGGYIYFDVSQSGWGSPSSVEYIISHDSYSCWYAMSNISNTKLYYISSGSWSDAKYIAFTKNYGWTNCEGNSYDHRTGYQPSGGLHTAKSTYGVNSGSTYLFYASNSSDGAAITTSSPAGYLSGGYGDLNSTQTINTVVKTGSGSYTSANSKATISITSYKMTGNGAVTKQTASLSTSAKTQTVSAARTATTTYTVGDVASGYQFDGWYTADTGGSLLSSSKTYTYYPTAATTVYARFSEKMSTVTLSASPSGKGSFTIGGAAATSTSVGVTTTKSVTAVPASGYHFVSWSITGGATISNTTANPTTVTGGGAGTAATLTATFEADAVNSLTVSKGTGISSVTGSTSPVTLGSKYAISATVATGYTFSSWTASPAANGTFDNASSASTNVTVKNGSVVVTASALERMSALSTSCHYDAGNPSYAAPTVSGSATNVGYVTTQTITAASAGTGYTFAGWTLTNCTRTDGGAPTATSITIRSNGDGAAASVVANYNEDLTTTWYIAGDGNGTGTDLTPGSPFSGWGTSGTRMSKKTGHSTEEIYYCTITVSTVATTDDHFPFKVYNSTGTQYYGNNGYWVTKENNHPTLSSTSGSNMKFRPYVTGTYEFKLDNTGANPVLTVTWPVFNQVRISAATPTDATNTGNFDLSDPVSNVRTVTRSLKANTTYTFKIMYNSDWYGYNSGTFTRSTSTSSNSRTLSAEGGNLALTTDYAGDYTFRFNQSTKDLSVDFPTAYKVTYGKGTVDGSSSSCSAKDIDNGNAAVTSNSTWVKSGNRVVLTAPVAKTGYTYNGWFDNNSGTGTAITTNANCTITVSSALTRYACYTINNHAITHSDASHGSYTIKVGSAAAVSANTTSDYGKTITLAATPATGYHFGSWSAYKTDDPATTVTVTSNLFTMPDYAVTVGATFASNTYSVTFDANGGTGDAMSPQAFTYDVAQALSANTYTRTGYDFDGWATAADGAKVYDPAQSVSNLTATNGGTFPLFAHWAAKSYTVTLDINEANHGTIDGKATSASVTFDAAPTAIVAGQLPTAAQGYAFMGFFTAAGGEGVQVINANGTWIASVTGYTDGSGQWILADDATLYAYYKKAQITNLTFDAAVVAPSASVGVTPTVAPTPAGTNSICWKLLYSNGNLYSPQPDFDNPRGIANKVTFTAPGTSGTYLVAAVLRTGSSCDGGTKLDSVTYPFQVAGDHTVTVQYKCGDVTLQGAKSISARPLVWSDEITPDEIFGYSFEKWVAGDGVTMTINGGETTIETGGETTGKATTHAVQIKAIYDGKLIAKYTKKNIIYFKNTLGWSEVYVNLYPYAWWDNYKGAGNNTLADDKRNKQMTQLGETDIWYYEYGNTATTAYVSFTDRPQDGYVGFAGTSGSNKVQVSYPTRPDATKAENANYGFNAGTPMFVPTAGQTAQPWNKSGSEDLAEYYNKGYWRKYDPIQGETGYTLKVYDKTGADGRKELKSIKFVESDVPGQLFKAVADLEAAGGYGIKFERDNSMLYTDISGHLHHTGDVVTTEKGDDNYAAIWIKATAAGDYTFAITINGDGKLCIQAEFPVAENDYRVIYTDNDTWTEAHTAKSWIHPSRIISAEENAVDTISFFVSKGHSPEFKIQRVNSINKETGAITWTDVTSWTSCDNVDASGVYNFIFTQDGSKNISFAKKEPYTGNFYIRTDAAGSTKWDNYRAADHLMTYSEYSETHSDYTHYFVKFVSQGTNVKFVVANDYSPCISDTLKVQTYRGGDSDHVDGNGFLNSNLPGDGVNVRYMWDIRNNAVYRAYLAPAQRNGSKFLVLRSNSSDDLRNEYDVALTGDSYETPGNSHGGGANCMQFVDNENWIYEATVMVRPSAYVKLYGHFHGTNFYFKGNNNDEFNGTKIDGIPNAIQLVTGSTGSRVKVRVIYDFKTDRLVAAYMPSGNIDEQMAINADVMFIREHQGDIDQLTFSEKDSKMGAITDIKTAYAVMRFNKWTLNNKETTGEHNVLASPKSIYERSLYYVSFPFPVNLNEVFGFGTYGQHWIIQRYRGDLRAQQGFWAESAGFWEFIWNRNGVVLQPNEGYILTLETELLGETSDVWGPESVANQVELYFPSTGSLGSITNASITQTLPAHTCTINRHETEGLPDTSDPSTSYNRTIFDSHWNIMSVPTYFNVNNPSLATTTWLSNDSCPKFLYTWNPDDNTLTATSGTGFMYHAMHAYTVQYYGNVTWTTSVTPTAAPQRNTEYRGEYEFCLEVQQDDQMIDRTYVRLSDDENVTTGFEFGEDMTKQFNSRKANIFTIAGNTSLGGNSLPLSTTQTTVVPVGVSIKSAGDYTFAIPEGTEGIGVTLVDNETGVRTSLSALNYTVTLQPGNITDRFVLEISPIHNTPTGLEEPTSDSSLKGRAQKVMIDGILYIVKDGKIFDARGARVE